MFKRLKSWLDERKAMKTPTMETVVDHTVDPDFGALQLFETRTMGQSRGDAWKQIRYHAWKGTCDAIGASVSISGDLKQLDVPDSIRALYRKIVANPETLKREVAKREIGLARDWAASGSIDTSFSEQDFATMLNITEFSIQEDRLTVWLEETQDIFAGHSIEVRYENGVISEIGLAG
jgi:Uncharacterized protein conserved in bacteria (DUF2262)